MHTVLTMFVLITQFFFTHSLNVYLTPERPMGHICPMFISCIYYMNITKKTILNSHQFYFR